MRNWFSLLVLVGLVAFSKMGYTSQVTPMQKADFDALFLTQNFETLLADSTSMSVEAKARNGLVKSMVAALQYSKADQNQLLSRELSDTARFDPQFAGGRAHEYFLGAVDYFSHDDLEKSLTHFYLARHYQQLRLQILYNQVSQGLSDAAFLRSQGQLDSAYTRLNSIESIVFHYRSLHKDQKTWEWLRFLIETDLREANEHESMYDSTTQILHTWSIDLILSFSIISSQQKNPYDLYTVRPQGGIYDSTRVMFLPSKAGGRDLGVNLSRRISDHFDISGRVEFGKYSLYGSIDETDLELKLPVETTRYHVTLDYRFLTHTRVIPSLSIGLSQTEFTQHELIVNRIYTHVGPREIYRYEETNHSYTNFIMNLSGLYYPTWSEHILFKSYVNYSFGDPDVFPANPGELNVGVALGYYFKKR